MSFPHTLLAHALLWPSLRALSPGGWCIVVGALFAGGLVKGIVSIGVPLIAIPLLTGLLSVKQAVLLISMPIIIGNIPQAAEGGHTWPALKKIAPLVIGAVIGSALGVHILFAIPGTLAAAISGGILIVACLVLLFAPRFSLPARTARPAGFIAGLLSGLMEGISAIPGPLLATYLIASGSTGRRFTKEIALVLVISISVLIAVFGQLHHANAADLVISALASVPVIAGIIAGRPLRDALPPRAFRVLVLVFIIIAAGQMILRSGIIHA
jgi:uncharacterized membrane protein YfcA